MKMRLLVAVLSGMTIAAPQAICRQQKDTSARPDTLIQVWNLDAAYSDVPHGVTFRYPSLWKARTQFGYHPPALTSSDWAPVAGFGYSDWDSGTGPYAGTSLEGVGVVYSIAPSTGEADCKAKAVSISDGPSQQVARLGGRSFTVYQTSSAGMNQENLGTLYVTYADSSCYLFETDTAESILGEASGGRKALTPAQVRFIEKHLRAIIETVRIAPAAGH